jgi:hypothetical protein
MILVPDAKALTGTSTDPQNGGPCVRYAGTPYAHIIALTMAPDMHKQGLSGAEESWRNTSSLVPRGASDPRWLTS